jgi:RNA recognition motif-containing protein
MQEFLDHMCVCVCVCVVLLVVAEILSNFLDRDAAGISFCSFILEKTNQINTVRVSNVSPRATEHDIQDFFSFSGEIEHVELHK